MTSNEAHKGFTLLELMVVIVIIGFSLGIVGMTVNTGTAQSQMIDEIDKFMGIANFASERAILSGETMGLRIEPPLWQAQRGDNVDDIGWRYVWVTNSSEGWQSLPNIKYVTLPPSMDLIIEVDEELWDYEAQLDRSTPIAAYYSSGDVTEIRIELQDKEDSEISEVIEVDENGELVWLGAPEMPEGDENGF